MSVSRATGADPDTLVVSGWSAASPYGLGAAAFAAGVREDRDAVRPGDRDLGPYERAGLLPDFDIRRVLGRKGTRAMDRATAIAVATVGMLLEEAGPGLAADRPEAVGMVLGTGHGSVQSIMDFTRDSLTGEKPYHVDPAAFPNTVMNRAAGQSAIWHTLRGPNTTLAGGAPTGLLTLSYAARLLRRGHCEAVLCGAVEEFSAERAWLEYRARTGSAHRQPAGPLGEGCALFLLEPYGRALAHGRTAHASLLSCRFTAFHDPEDAPRAVTRAVTEALKDASVEPGEVALLVPSDTGGPLGAREDAALGAVFGESGPPRLRLRRLIGDTSAASASLQLAAAVCVPDGRRRPVLITSVDPDGQTGAVVLRTGNP
ncbi:beta-ketoacyl synthase N-terminal-like domain-containing protein [Streptomyces sp. NPDC004609]|uniref:beta-ketoacyl synthase N-terminal-like domain-containing protein n=1 Tax=Streptomyces sp. NPDC004609 TaxID=3364704 RepID=UPI0036A1909B